MNIFHIGKSSYSLKSGKENICFFIAKVFYIFLLDFT